jgi:P4 family phage/plasmid primase-like protien
LIYYMKEFLTLHNSKDAQLPVTHTRIGNRELKVYGAAYHIPDEDMAEFYQLYHKEVFVRGNLEYMTEIQRDEGPLGVDIDLRYNKAERCYTKANLVDLIEVITDLLEEMFVTIEPFDIYLFEKPDINVGDVIKDGVHFIFALNLDKTAKKLLYARLLARMGTVLASLKEHLTNDWESVLDNGVFTGQTGWQLYGSRKPGFQAYKLTKVYRWRQNELDEMDMSTFDVKARLPNMSIRCTANPVPVLKPALQDEYDAIKTGRTKRKLRVTENGPSDIRDVEMLDTALDRLFKTVDTNDYRLAEIHKYVMILPASYYGPNSYTKWIRVGWALKNTDFRLFVSWLKMSSQSADFDFSQVGSLFQQWCSWPKQNECLTERSILYWARSENPAAYEKIKDETIDNMIDELVEMKEKDVTEYDLAKILHRCYGDIYACVNIRNKVWYEWNQRWIETDSGTSLFNRISSQDGICGIFSRRLKLAVTETAALPEDHPRKAAMQAKTGKIGKLVTDLKKSDKKGNIMRESLHLFYVDKFLNLLDSKNHILCFSNGVIDFSIGANHPDKLFRPGVPEDYTSKCCNIPYVKLSQSSTAVIEEVVTFMEQLFPVPELRNYMWEHAASVCLGTNNNQTFNIYMGHGSNGKSKFVELMGHAFGDYKATVPVTLVTGKRTGIGSVSPEVMQLKGIRYAVMQEPSVGDSINEGIMKELTGGDPIQGRELYSTAQTFKPQFNLVVCTNTLFNIKSNDEGTWRRIRVCDFMSKFTDDLSEGLYKFKIDKNIDAKFESWKSVFLSMLVHKAHETKGMVKDCAIVLAKSNSYRQEQDTFSDFVKAAVVKKATGFIKVGLLNDAFKSWWANEKGEDARSLPKAKDLHAYMNRKFGDKIMFKNINVWMGVELLQPADECDED